VFLGDLNTTRHFVDEAGKTVPGNQHLAALEEMGWIEALRTCYPGPQAGSWYSTIGNGFRVDQAWLSPPLINRLVSAELDHSVRLAGYSDHSLLVVELEGE
jgi:exonuclease III